MEISSLITDIVIFSVAVCVLGIVLYLVIDFYITKNKIEDIYPPAKSTTQTTTASTSTSSSNNTSTTAKTTTTTQEKAPTVKSEYDILLSRYPSLSKTLPEINVPVDVFYKLMILMQDAINKIKENITVISRPLFYQQQITILLTNFPFFKSFMVFSSYVYRTPGINRQTIHDALIALYDSEKSPLLYVDVNGLKYYMVLEFDNFFDVYERNADYVDKYLGK
jgi:hypothetical protein